MKEIIGVVALLSVEQLNALIAIGALMLSGFAIWAVKNGGGRK